MVRGPIVIVVAALAAAALAAPAAAQPTYVDPVLVLGGVDEDAAREVVVAAVGRAGLRAIHGDGVACDEASACLADRARAAGAAAGLRVTIADVAGGVVASVIRVDLAGRSARQVLQVGSLEALEAELAALLAPPARRRDRRAGWVAVGVTGALAAAGLAATWYAHDHRDDFFAAHVDAGGDIVGITPEGARRAEARARRWSFAGGALFAAAGATGVVAAVLLVRERGGEARSGGLAIGGRF